MPDPDRASISFPIFMNASGLLLNLSTATHTHVLIGPNGRNLKHAPSRAVAEKSVESDNVSTVFSDKMDAKMNLKKRNHAIRKVVRFG